MMHKAFSLGVCYSVYCRHYESMLQALMTVVYNTSQAPRIVDNVCAALCRMIVSHPDAVLQQEVGSGLQC